MRWKPDGRAGIEDRRDENDKPNGPVERHAKGMAEWERDNYLRRTSNRPELPLPPNLKPAVRPGDGWGATNAPAERPASEGWSAPMGPTNPIVDSFFSENTLRQYQDSLRKRLSPAAPHTVSGSATEILSRKMLAEAHKQQDKPVRSELASGRRVLHSGILEKIAKLRAIRRGE